MRPVFLRKLNLVTLLMGSTLLWGVLELIALQLSRVRKLMARPH